MKLCIGSLHPANGGKARRPGTSPSEVLAEDYLARVMRYCTAEAMRFADEAELFAWVARQHARTPIYLCLLDSLGTAFSSKAFAEKLRSLQDQGRQQVIFAIGPADGWTPEARGKADLLLSLGPMTLPHELARVVLAEQVYRALTILAGHPYHSGH